MNILGFNCYSHDAAATLVSNGEVRFAVEDERLTRKKHCGGFPQKAIQACLDSQSLKLQDIQHIGFSWKPWISYPQVPLFFLRFAHKMPALLRESQKWTMEENMGMFNYWKAMHQLPQKLTQTFANESTPSFKFHYLEHHFCHAASAYYCTDFEDAAIMTVDGGGEWTTTQASYGQNNDIHKLFTVNIPHSLGAFYQAIARYCGFEIVTGPGKLMGLSAYGNKNHPIYHRLRKLIHFREDGSFRLDLSYFAYHYTRNKAVSDKFEHEFGPACPLKAKWQEHHLHVAAAAQRIVEEYFIHLANKLHERTRSTNLCIAGGVGLNSVANGRLVDETPFKKIFIQPAAGDSGTSLGAALWIKHKILNIKNRFILKNAFLGPGYATQEYHAELKNSSLPFICSDDYTRIAAKLLHDGKILGWFQGQLEFGPRALGNRSILANPCIPEMKDILNARVKFRESFRPFAPIVLEEECGEYFDKSYPNPYMLLVYGVRPNKQSIIPAVTHVDGTGRIQTVNADENPQLWELLHAFKDETGVPVLINTSFNVKGEPIVSSPYDAIDSFVRSDIDYLILGNFIAAKKVEHLQTEAFRPYASAATH